MKDLPDQITDELEEFFVDNKKLEGKKFRALDKVGQMKAVESIMDDKE